MENIQRKALLLGGMIFILDQISKPWILSIFETRHGWIEVTPFFNLVLVYNNGVSFGLFANDATYGPYILAAMAVGISLAIWWFLLRKAETKVMALSAGLIIGGAIGNALDRVLYGAVVDFLDFHIAGYHWPAFNIADCAIVVGALAILLDGLYGSPKLPK